MADTDTIRTQKSNHIGVWILLLFVFICELVFYTWCRVQCTRVGYEMTKETDINRKLVALQSSMAVELTRLKSPDRISSIARQQLKLEPPSHEQMLVLP